MILLLQFSIRTIYFPTLANILREKGVLSGNSAQVACDPLGEQKSASLTVPFFELCKKENAYKVACSETGLER